MLFHKDRETYANYVYRDVPYIQFPNKEVIRPFGIVRFRADSIKRTIPASLQIEYLDSPRKKTSSECLKPYAALVAFADR